MISNRTSLSRNFTSLLTSNGLSQLIPILLAPIIGRIFNPEDVAIQENFIAFATLLSVIAALSYESALVLPKDIKKANNLFALTLFISAGFSILCFLLRFFKSGINELYQNTQFVDYILLIPIAVFLIALSNILTQWLIRNGQYPTISLNRFVQTTMIHSGYVLFGYLGWGVNGMITSWLLALFLPNIHLLKKSLKFFDRNEVDLNAVKSVAVEYKNFPLVNSFQVFANILATQFLLFWIILYQYGAVALGLFALMNRYVRAPFNIVGSALGLVYYREAADAYNKGEDVMVIFTKSLKLIWLVGLCITLVITFAGPFLFEFYLGEKWKLSGEFASIIAPSIFFNFLFSPVSTTPWIYGKQKSSFVFSISGYSLGLGFLFFGSYFLSSFKDVLIGYSILTSLFYISQIFWFIYLIKSNKTNNPVNAE